MNERNVAALAELLRETHDYERNGWRDMAERLAARGVLVPAALTDDDVDTYPSMCDGTGCPRTAAEMCAKLEAIARGEPS